MDLGLKGKTALVLGASGGLGSAISRTLAEEGARIIGVGRNSEKLDRLAEELRGIGAVAEIQVCDFIDRAAVDALGAGAGDIDILVNVTGGPPPTTAAGQSSSLWEQQFQAMVLSVISLTDAVLPGMRQRGWGRVITSTSSGVVAPIANLGISNALRMTLLGWSKTLAREVAKDGVTANVIVPGRIATDRIQFLDTQKAKRDGRAMEDVVAESIDSIPTGRYGSPVEYAAAVAFLASEQASYITGTVVRVDGGLLSNV